MILHILARETRIRVRLAVTSKGVVISSDFLNFSVTARRDKSDLRMGFHLNI